jgi:hypothetical protein
LTDSFQGYGDAAGKQDAVRRDVAGLIRPTGRIGSIFAMCGQLHSAPEGRKSVREKSNFACRFMLIWVVQSFGQKLFCFVFAEIDVCLSRSAPTQGAYRDRHDTRCGMRWTWMR